MTLYDATRHLHHACERHPFGERMAKGEITAQEWCDWLASLRVLHLAVDAAAPRSMARKWGFHADLAELEDSGATPRRIETASIWAMILDGQADRREWQRAACYVLHGAHRRGGRAMQPVMATAGLPCWHLHYPDPKAAEAFIVALRENLDLAPKAQDVFGLLLRVMDEVSR